MLVVVSYDVSTVDPAGKRRLRRVAQTCENYGQRVQNSVFECLLRPDEWTKLKAELLKAAKLEQDSLRFYYLGNEWQKRVEHFGTKTIPDLQRDVLIL